MGYSMHDVLMISLQFFYAFGGLILIGSLIFSIMKNQALVNEKRLRFEQDFDVELASQLAQSPTQEASDFKPAQKVGETAFHGNTPVKKGKTPGNMSGVRQVGGHTSNMSGDRQVGGNTLLKNRVVSVRQGGVHKSRANRYRVAASLAARGFNAKDIGNKVGLPQCEVDLITSLNNTSAKGSWEEHQAMLDAIDSYG